MVRIEKSVVIDQPVEQVFEFVINAENDPLWQTQIQESKATSDGPFGVGTTTAQTAQFLGRRIETTAEITAYEQDRSYAWKSISGPVPGEGQSIFEAVGEGQTKFTIIGDVDVGGFFKLAEPLVARSARRMMETNLANLKDLLEA
jgi:uncharacterized membrane protein